MVDVRGYTGHGGGTRRLHQKYLRVAVTAFFYRRQDLARNKSSIFDGGEIGSTGI